MPDQSGDRRAAALLLGATGFVGSHLISDLARRYRVTAARFTSPEIVGVPGDVRWVQAAPDLRGLDERLGTRPFAAIVNAAALSSIADCEANPQLAALLNDTLPARMAARARGDGARLIHLSTDQVFDGTNAPYSEGDAPTPTTEYGRTKVRGEASVLESGADAAVVRLNLVYGASAGGRPSGPERMVAAARGGQEIPLFTDEFRSPVSVVDAAHAVAELLRSRFFGVLHLGGPERLSRFELGLAILDLHGLAKRARPGRLSDYRGPPRSPDTTFDDSLAREVLVHPPGPLSDSLRTAFGN